MSILIKGMEMPKACYYCHFLFRDKRHNKVYCTVHHAFDKWLDISDAPAEGRANDCPLIELPPHGRLIDADALNELIDSGDDIDFSEVLETKYAIMRMVDEQDTILEASPYQYKMTGKTDNPHGIYFIESEGEE